MSGDRELQEEIRFHLEMETEKNRRNGMSEHEARRAARRAFGGVHQVREEVRDLRRIRIVEDVWRDVSYSFRTLRRSPAYALTTILIIALTVGVAAAILTFIDQTLFRPLPYRQIEGAVTLWETNLATGEGQMEVSPANFLDWKERSRSFESLGLLAPSGVDLRTGQRVVAIESGRVSLDFFPALGVTPHLGRLFEPRDFDPGAEPRVILSHASWLKRFNGDPRIIGRSIELDGKPVPVAAVLPEGVDYPADAEMYTPLHLFPGEKGTRTGNWTSAVGRLRSGVSLAEARADLDRIATMLGREHPETNENLRVRVIPLREAVLGRTRRLLVPLAGGSICLLLIACANLGALALARGAARRRELAIRASLGAGTARLMRQLVTESVVLNFVAALAAMAIAFGVVRWMSANSPDQLRPMRDVDAGAITLAFLVGLTLLNILLSGALPALRLVRGRLAADAEASRRGSGLAEGEARAQGVLVVAQLALALVLLTSAGLLLRSLQKLTANDLGFEPRGLATMQMYLYDLHPNPKERAEFVRASLADIRSLPGVTHAAATTALPFDSAMGSRDDFQIIGRPRRPGESLILETGAVTPGYFETMRIPLRAGRDFNDFDRLGGQRVAIINEAAVRRYWGSVSPLGTVLRIGIVGRPYEWTIVGVVANVRDSDYAAQQGPAIYVPLAQSGVGGLNYIVRSNSPSRALLDAMQGRIWRLTPSQSIASAELMPRLVGRTLQTHYFAILVLSGFAVVALAVSCIGVFGLLTYVATRRKTEIGIRLALGATPPMIERHFVTRGAALGGMGILIGLILSFSLTRVLGSLLYQTSALDPLAIGGVLAAMTVVILVASWIPARRIASLDLGMVLRGD